MNCDEGRIYGQVPDYRDSGERITCLLSYLGLALFAGISDSLNRSIDHYPSSVGINNALDQIFENDMLR